MPFSKGFPGFPGGTSGKELACNTGDIRHVGLILGQEDLLEEGDPLQYSCLENPVDRGAW